MLELTTLPVKKVTRDRLKSFGVKGESYDTILLRLMEIAQESAFWERQVRILKESRFHSIDEVLTPPVRRSPRLPSGVGRARTEAHGCASLRTARRTVPSAAKGRHQELRETPRRRVLPIARGRFPCGVHRDESRDQGHGDFPARSGLPLAGLGGIGSTATLKS